MKERVRPHVELTHWSPNRSSRAGARPVIITVHATAGHNRPGIADLAGLGGWFGQQSSEVSSHVATDNEARSARFVADLDKAWHCAGFNRMSLGIEQVIPGDGTELTPELYQETARWIALWSHLHGIPIRAGQVAGARIVRGGVIRHSQLGIIGGGHSDPGAYDEHHLLDRARWYYRKAYA